MRIWLSWSSGKDSAWALHQLRSDPGLEVVGLLTTVNQEYDRVAMHGVRRSLLEAQAIAVGLPLIAIDLPWPCDNATYQLRMASACERAVADGVEGMAFGDLFLEDIRAYRDASLRRIGLEAVFPIWMRDTRELAREMVDAGLVAHLVCVDPKQLDPSFAGRRFDHALLDDLPAGVDPCGENGEFHTFVSAGPMFDRRIPVVNGAVVERDGFVFADLLPG